MNKKEFFIKHVPQDGWMFKTGFDGETEDESFLKLKTFLQNEGFAEIPLPSNAKRLWWDYLRPDEEGNFGRFIWHPIIITQDAYQVNGLVLCVCNEDFPAHFEAWEGATRK